MKKALLIGINYTGQSAQLNGCVNDINNIKNILVSNWGYPVSNIKILLNENATDVNMKNEIVNLTKGCAAGDTLFFYYSGHGVDVANTQNADKGEQDDALVPVNYTNNGVIIDDWLYTNLVMKVPNGVSLWGFTDCCHSGTMFDLKYNWLCNPTLLNGKAINSTKTYNEIDWSNNFNMYIINNKETEGSVFLFSGCQDSQTSADAFINNQSQGAFTYCLLTCIKNKLTKPTKQTIGDMLKEIDCLLVMNNYKQRSQLSVGRTADINFIFSP